MNAVIAYFMTMFSRFEDKAKGATAVEYGLMVAGIAVAIITVVFLLGDTLSGLFNTVQGSIAGAG